MKLVEMWRWYIPRGRGGKMVETRYKIAKDEVLARWPNAKPVLGTMELREVAETPEEISERAHKTL